MMIRSISRFTAFTNNYFLCDNNKMICFLCKYLLKNTFCRAKRSLHFSKNILLITSSRTSSSCPTNEYNRRVERDVIQPDDSQIKVLSKLDTLHANLEKYETERDSLLSRFFSKNAAPLGMYIHGRVGCGKTMLMDLLYECCSFEAKIRVHFHSFMLGVHKEVHRLKQSMPKISSTRGIKPFDPIPIVAADIAKIHHLLCFDEFQVTDIADAMMLKRLFEHLFLNNVIVVATSNRAPDELYLRGLQRANFLPFIPVLKKYCSIVDLNSQDYRLTKQPSKDLYILKNSSESMETFSNIFYSLVAEQEDSIVRPRTIAVMGRTLHFTRTCGKVVCVKFQELCEKPLGAADYLAIANDFDVICLEDIPRMTLRHREAARRFITLIDTLYDAKSKLVCLAEVLPQDLFTVSAEELEAEKAELQSGGGQQDAEFMDALQLSAEERKISAFTGEEEQFAFERTVSRLTEMQSGDYWQRSSSQIYLY